MSACLGYKKKIIHTDLDIDFYLVEDFQLLGFKIDKTSLVPNL